MTLFFHGDTLMRADGCSFDPWHWRWSEPPPPDGSANGTGRVPQGEAGAVVSPAAAVRQLHAGGRCRRWPVAVIGPREASATQERDAEEVGEALARLGFTLLCGGRQGVMEAAARGAARAGGLTVGLLPDADWRTANAHIALPIATGIGRARNALIAQAAMALIAVGGQYGTIVEAAYGLHFGKSVIGLNGPPAVPGVREVASVGHAMEVLCAVALGLPESDAAQPASAVPVIKRS